MNEQEEKMMFAAFALAGLMSNLEVNPNYAAEHSWYMAELMMHNKPKEKDNENSDASV